MLPSLCVRQVCRVLIILRRGSDNFRGAGAEVHPMG